MSQDVENKNAQKFRFLVDTYKVKYQFKDILFSSEAKKVNLRSQVSDRVLLFTDTCILKLNAKFKVLKQISYMEATGLAVTSGGDQLFVLKIPGNDLVVCFHNSSNENRVTEAMAVAFQRMRKAKRETPGVSVEGELPCVLGSKERTIIVRPTNQRLPSFKKNGSRDLLLLATQ